MPDEPSTNETIFSNPGKALSDYRRVISEYLRDKDTDFTPAMLGGVLGAGAAGLTTARRSNETPVQRALRTVRNAAVGGALGAVGGQATAFGIGRTAQAVEGLNPEATPPQPGSGMLHSLAARLGLAGVAPAVQWNRHRRGIPQMEAIGKIFPSSLNELQMRHNDPSHPINRSAPVSLGGADPARAKGTAAKAKAWADKFSLLGGEGIRHPGAVLGAKTTESLARQLYRQNPAVGNLFGIADGSADQEGKTVKALSNYLRGRFGIGGRPDSGFRQLLYPAERFAEGVNQRFNPKAFSTSGLSRAAGAGGMLSASALGFVLPDILSRVDALGDDVKVFTPHAPAADTSQPPEAAHPLLQGFKLF